ncbi:MAG: hypothetical protein M5T61_07035 [Acidimicrobiia bacterium]|nr:hypothetical protein [Acidimicrobiia bacterium]
MRLYERMGASLGRAPYVWLFLTLVFLVAVMPPAARPPIATASSPTAHLSA